MHTELTPSSSDLNPAPETELPPESPYKLLLRLPDLGKSVGSGRLGKLRVNWRRRTGGRADRRWWARVPAKWIAASAAALILLAATVAVLSPSRQEPSTTAEPSSEHTVAADSKAAQPEQAPPAQVQSVVPAGYQTDESVDAARPTRSVPSLLTLRPAKLTGLIELVETEVQR